MGFLTTLRLKNAQRKKYKEEYRKKANSELRASLKEETAVLKSQKEYYKNKRDLNKVRSEIRKERFAPLRNIVSDVRGGLKKTQQRSASNNSRNDLFGNTKTPDELLYGRKPLPLKTNKALPKKQQSITIVLK